MFPPSAVWYAPQDRELRITGGHRYRLPSQAEMFILKVSPSEAMHERKKRFFRALV